MQLRLFKEIRLLFPAWAVAVALSLCPAIFLGREGSGGAVLFLGLCCPLIAASSFGFEFSNGTLAQLLSQPVDRRRLWFKKMSILGALLAPLASVSLLISFGRIDKPLYWLLLLIPVCCFCATPFFTFLTC